MKNKIEVETDPEEKGRNTLAGLAVGAALGVVFWSALSDLLPFPLDALVGMGTGLLAGYRIGDRLTVVMRYPPRVVRRMLAAGALFLLGTLGYLQLLELNLTAGQKMLASLVAVLPGVFFVAAIGMAVASLDEMQRRIQVEGIAIGFGGTAVYLLALAQLSLAGIQAPGPIWTLLVMALMWLAGKLWLMWKYR